MKIANKRYVITALVILGITLFIAAGSVLQRTAPDVFASPDETAVMQFARSWADGGGFRLAHGIPDAYADIASLHPRSIVRRADYLLPVGFLGMPLIIGLFEMIYDGLGVYVTLLLVLSAAYPLWNIVKTVKSPRVAVLTVIVFLSFPTVLLYVNRGLSPNLPVVALVLWGIWGVWVAGSCASPYRRWTAAFASGIAIGAAFIIRPTEAVWILPWILWTAWASLSESGKRPLGKRALPYALTIMVIAAICTYGVFLSMQTYPYHDRLSDQPVIAYLLHDHVSMSEGMDAVRSMDSFSGWEQYLPYGFHPRAMWSNVQSYLFTYLGLWVGAALFGAAYAAARHGVRKRGLLFLLACLWTLGVLILFYGQAEYTDNIRGSVSLGNSFLRYMLPLVPLIAYGCALAIDALCSVRPRGRMLGFSLAILFLLLGWVMAFAHDEEGILKTRYELRRYMVVQNAALNAVSYPAFILSERSDKIFASGPFIAVSPMPERSVLERLRSSPYGIYLFHRTFGGGGRTEQVVMDVFGKPIPLFNVDNEVLYQLQASDEGAFSTIAP